MTVVAPSVFLGVLAFIAIHPIRCHQWSLEENGIQITRIPAIRDCKVFAGRLDLKRAGVPSNHRAKGDREHRQVIAERTYGVVAGGLSIQNLHERGPVLCSARSASVCLLADSKTHLP